MPTTLGPRFLDAVVGFLDAVVGLLGRAAGRDLGVCAGRGRGA